MINIFVQYMLGPVGRAIENLYLDNGFIASLLVLTWMIVVFQGLRSVSHMKRQLYRWVAEVLPNYAPDQRRTPERIQAALEARWNEEAAKMRFMPALHGLWIQRANPQALRTHVGFTTEGIEQIITRITGRKRETKLVAVDAVVRTARTSRSRKHVRA